MTDIPIIPAADLPVVAPGEFDYVVGVQLDENRRFPVSGLAAAVSLQVSFQQSGTGSVQRLARDKLLELPISPEDFDAVGDGTADDTAAWVLTLAEHKASGREIKAEGVYRITSTLEYDVTGLGNTKGLRIRGAGMAVSGFINAITAGGPTIKLTGGSSASDIAHGGYVKGFYFSEDGSGADSHGIEFDSIWEYEFDDLDFRELNGSGLRPLNLYNDADSSVNVSYGKIRAVGCVGPALDTNGGTGGISLHTLRDPYFINNGAGDAQIVLDGVVHFTIEAPSLAGFPGSAGYDTNIVGIHIKKTSLTCRSIRIKGGEIGNSLQKGIVVDAVNGLEIDNPRFTKRAGETTFTTGIELKDGTANTIRGVVIKRPRLQLDTATPAFTLVSIGTAVASDFKFYGAVEDAFASGNTLFAFTAGSEDFGGYLEDTQGRVLFAPRWKRERLTHATPGSVALDLSDACWHQLNLTGVGTYVVDAPSTGAADGALCAITIINNASLGAARVSFSPTIEVRGYIDPASNSTAYFRYDSTSAVWRQVGQWSVSARPYASNVGNVGTGEDDLMSHVFASNTMRTSSVIKIVGWGSYANNANAKTLRLKFGTTTIATLSLTTSQSGFWRIDADVIVAGASLEKVIAHLYDYGTASKSLLAKASPTETVTSGIEVKITGEATSNNDIVQEGMIVRIEN